MEWDTTFFEKKLTHQYEKKTMEYFSEPLSFERKTIYSIY